MSAEPTRGCGKTKPISRPSAGNPKYEARNPKSTEFAWAYLKKQSQFATCANGRKCLIWKGLYEKTPVSGAKKQSQFKANRRVLGGKLEAAAYFASATADAMAKFAVWVMLTLMCSIPSSSAILLTCPATVTSG